MTRTATLLLTVVLVIGSISAFPMAAAAQSSSSVASAIGDTTYAQVDENASETAVNVTSGERLSAVVGVAQAEFEGEIEQRAYGIEYARAASDNAKADVVADRLNETQQRLDELEAQKNDLEEARENGEISEGEFQAQAAELAARTETVKKMADASEARANELPAELLESKGINVTAIQELKMNAENLTGPEVAAIAQSIAGEDVGQSVSEGPPEDVGVPGPDQAGDGDGGADEAQGAIDRAEEQLNAAEDRLNQTEERLGENASENATDALEQARDELDRARQALADARDAFDDGNQEQAFELAQDALNHAAAADDHLQDALEAAQQDGQDTTGADAGEDNTDQSGTG
jgi:chromosome segregation ATPase